MALPVIAVTNQSTVLSDDQVRAVLPALQHQVSQDVKAYWEVDCTLWFLPKDQPLPLGWWQIVIVDNPDIAGALGYHDLSANGTPLGKVFAKLDIQDGLSWTVTLSHELLEMILDPWINVCAEGTDGKIYAYEIADPCEADDYGYLINGVLVSDFITPDWFNPETLADRFDFKQHITAPFQLLPGGYISIRDPKKGWIQVYARVKASKGRMGRQLPQGSRRSRRAEERHNWRRSTVQAWK